MIMTEYFSLFSFLTAAVAGTVTVFLPCTYPMIIGYIALIIGDRRNDDMTHILRITFWFFVGFTVTFMVFGSIAGLFGQFSETTLIVNSLRPILTIIGGVFFIIIGLLLLQAIPLPSKLRSMRAIPIPSSLTSHSWWRSCAIGAIFAAGWSPCIGPVLGGMLVLAASSQSVIAGTLLMFMFSVGMVLPMLVIALLYGKTAGRIRRFENIMPIMRVIGGALFIFLGIIFIMGDFSVLGSMSVPAFLVPYI